MILYVLIAAHAAHTVCVCYCREDSAAVAVYRAVNRTRPLGFLSFSSTMLQPFDFNGIGTRI